MTILSRLHKGINAIGGTINGVIGLPLDLARGMVSDHDEYDGIISTLYHTTINRGGQILSNTLGPEGLGSTLIAPIPNSFRSSVYDSTIEPALNAFETAGREGIREPLSALLTLGSLADAPGGGGILGLTDTENWKRAYRIAQTRSFGQSLAASFTHNINDEAELASYMNTDAFEIISGVADATMRMEFDFDVITGQSRRAFVAGRRGLSTPAQIARAVDHPKVIEFNEAVWDLHETGNPEGTAARIRSRFYPDHPRGPEIANALAEAETPQAQLWTLRALMKDPEAYARLQAVQSRTQPLIARATARLEDLDIMKSGNNVRYRGTVTGPTTPTIWDDDILRASAEVDQLYNFTNRAGKLLAASGAIQELPRVTRAGAIRESIVRSNYYSQRGSFSKPLHAVFDMNPQRLVNVSDMTGDVHLDRMLGVADIERGLRDTFRSRYMEATEANARQNILLEAQQTSIHTLASKAGMSTDEIATVMDNLARQRGHAVDSIAKRVFDDTGNSRFDILDENGEVIRHHLPASMSRDAVIVPLVDINEVKKATTRIGQFRSRHPTTSIPPALVESLYRVWKPAMLLRVGWPIKIIMDEQLRIMAKIGTLAQFKGLKTGLIDYSTDYISKARELGEGNIAKGIREVRGFKSKSLREEFGVRGIEYRGYDIEGVNGIKSDLNRNIMEQASANSTYRAIGGGTEEAVLNSLRQYGAHIRALDPKHADYAATYNYAADKLRTDPISKLLLATDSVDEVVAHLRGTVEGTEILRKSSVKAHDVRNWVNDINDQIEHYTASMPELRDKLANGRLTHDDLAAVISDPALRPPAHAEVLAQATGDSFIHRQLVAFVDGAYRRLGSTPTDILSRNRYIDHVYQAEVKRQIDLLGDVPLKQLDITRIEEGARTYALGETRNLLYDLAESSQLARMLKFLVPFYSAWQEVLTRWAGLAVENPAFMARMHQIWQAPERAGILTDENGREVEWGVDYGPDERGGERFINLPASWAKGLPGVREALDSKGNIKFNRKGLNMIMAGAPGVGIIVQVPVNEILKSRPDLEASVKFIAPFGAQYGLLQQVLPSYAKAALSQAEEDRSYTTAIMRIWTDKVVEYNLKMKDNPAYTGAAPTFEDAANEAQAFYNLKRIASFISPIALGFSSPYQLQIDAFRQAQRRYAEDKTKMVLADSEGNPRTPDEWFLDEYGKEYFALTQSVTRSLNGIPPTIEAWQASKELKGLIAENPEYGGLILGLDTGEFNSGVYNAQLNTRLSPTSNKNQREVIPLDEAMVDPSRRLGWIEYRRFIDGIEAARIAQNLPNLQVKKAKDLAEMKALFTEDLIKRNPAWADDFNQTDKGKWDKRIEVFTALADNPQLAGRTEFQLLKEYLGARETMNLFLTERATKKNGSKTLTASSNQDLKQLWDVMTGSLIERDLNFSTLFYRYLENDPLGL